MLHPYIQQLSAELKLTEEPKEQEGSFTLPITASFIVKLKPLKPTGWECSATIAECPKQDVEALFTQLMSANLFGMGTGGSALGLDAAAKNLILNQICSFEMSYAEFKQTLETFVNTLDFWQAEIAEHNKRAEAKVL